jgi:hypothetical protein
MPRIKLNPIGLILVVLGPLTLFGPMLIRGEVLYWGTPMLQFVPWHRFALETIRLGELPLWNPLLGMGAPLLANLQSALLYPPNLLLLFIGPEHGHGYLVTLHLLIAGIGMVLFSRKLGFGAFGQMVTGVTFSLSGYMIARAWFISINHAAAWLPWILLFTERLLERLEQRPPLKDTLPSILGLTLALTLQWLAGHAQTAWYSLILLLAWTLWRLSKHPDRTSIRWVLSRLLLAGFLAFVLAAAQLLPTIEYLAVSQRAGNLDREFALTYSFWPWRFLGLFFPNLFGNPGTGDYWGYGNFWEDAVYIGILPILLVLGSFWQGLRRPDKTFSLERFLMVLTVFTVLLALGKNTPIFPFLFDHVPTFNLFQAPARWNLLLMFAFALLAGKGADHWSAPTGRRLYWTRLLTAGAGVIALASYLGLWLMPQIEPTFVRSFASGGVLLTISGLLTLFLPKQKTDLKVGVIGCFILVDLILAGRGLNPSISPSVFEGNVLASSGIQTRERIFMPSTLEERLKYHATHRFDSFNPGIDWRVVRSIALPNTSLLEGISSVNNFDPMIPGRYAAFLERLETLEGSQQEQLLSWMGVAYRIAPDPADDLGVLFVPLATQGRFHMVPEALFVDSPDAVLEHLMSGEVDLQGQVLLEGEALSPSVGGDGGEILSVDEAGPHVLELVVESPEGGWLVVADTWYPGWVASVDGTQSELYRANYLFRAIMIPQGRHVVEFSYQPISFYLGSGLSAIGLIAIVLLGFVCYRRK